jgi:hypothetical protein
MSKITPAVEPEILAKAALGWPTRKIAEWLGTEHGIRVSFQAVAQMLEKTRDERADIAKTVVREKLAAQLCPDLDILGKWLAKLDAVAEDLGVSDPELLLKYVEQIRKIIDTKLHYSGADTPDDSLSELAAAHARVQARLQRLIDAEAEAERPN